MECHRPNIVSKILYLFLGQKTKSDNKNYPIILQILLIIVQKQNSVE